MFCLRFSNHLTKQNFHQVLVKMNIHQILSSGENKLNSIGGL